MLHGMPDANRIPQIALGFRAASKAPKILAKTRHALALPRRSLLYSQLSLFLYRDRSRIGLGIWMPGLWQDVKVYVAHCRATTTRTGRIITAPISGNRPDYADPIDATRDRIEAASGIETTGGYCNERYEEGGKNPRARL